MADKFIKIQALYGLLEIEPYILLGCLILIAWVFYKFFLKEVSEERHKSIRNHFSVLLRHFVILSFLFVLFIFLQSSEAQIGRVTRFTPYIAIFTFIWGNIVFVKTSRLIVLQYLFLGSMKHGVPLLLVNIFSLLLSIVLLFWGISHIFGLEIGPLLATSAAASVILGLALQDTLGNLFAGISLQVDRNFEMGDWLEIVSGIQKTTGQVREMTWRSVTLVGFSDEIITLPNRFMANAQISNYSPPDHPILRRQIFRLAYGENIELAKQILEQTVAGIGEIRGIPTPWAYVSDSTENWVELKILYFIDHFGSQFSIGDKVYVRGIESLRAAGIKLARQVIELSDKTHGHDSSKL
ncbi:mechanosensitive ion channel family protein [Bdellovibrio svalbardensis]|uniref:Mechanosensitive ion channel family protein n=1 Tax=Bdellovibrio svalbardensis TaxID=2972972 RepID=A0ABT6DKZ2_9BACT|nr:mechanosensitive ion channel family protein [Bdellovibrio svalbardensis]MDG0816559.1 mechanosensitive ion channel family protein [Bdellovibrio svalbardensis]